MDFYGDVVSVGEFIDFVGDLELREDVFLREFNF